MERPMSDPISPDLRMPPPVQIVNPVKTISWASVFAGAVIAMALQLLLTMLGIGFGLATDAAQTGVSSSAFEISGAIWWTGTALIALFVGGSIAGFFSDATRLTDGVLHGLLVWALTALVSAYVLGSYAASASRLLGTADPQTAGPLTDEASRALSQGALLWLGVQILGAASALFGGIVGRNLRRRRRARVIGA
jgi:hypothetical protein